MFVRFAFALVRGSPILNLLYEQSANITIYLSALPSQQPAVRVLNSTTILKPSINMSIAFDLLKCSAWFNQAPDDLLEALSLKMEPVEVDDGHIFFHEGMPIDAILVIEEGTLARTKLLKDSNTDVKSSLKTRRRLSSANLLDESILVDKISGRGRLTGLLHNVHEDESDAFATVVALGRTKVHRLYGSDFREIVSQNPRFALEVLQILAREIRNSTKSIRNLSSSPSKNVQGVGSTGKVCRVLCYDATSWVVEGFKAAIPRFNEQYQTNEFAIEMDYTTERLTEQSVAYAEGYDAICLFVNDTANAVILKSLSLLNVKMIAMRCAGFDRIDQRAAKAYDITVARVPAYSPYAVAEHAVALLLALNRKITKASNRVKMANFTLDNGLMGMDIHGKTVGVMGTGKIGQILVRILLGFGATVKCFDIYPNEEIKNMGATYTDQDDIFATSDVLFLMMPLLPSTRHTINETALLKLKRGVLLINTSRGGLVDSDALLQGLSEGIIGGVGMDVYENEQEYFFQDWSARHVTDSKLVSLLGQHNVLLTAHQAFFTKEAVDKIVSTTLDNLRDYSLNDLSGTSHPNNCIS